MCVFEVSGSSSIQGSGGGGFGQGSGKASTQGGGGGSGTQETGGRRSGEYGRRSPDDDRERIGLGRGSGFTRGGQRRTGSYSHSHSHSHNQQYPHHQQQQKQKNKPPMEIKPLVERPPAVQAMMEAVSKSQGPRRVVRVLARGEKLD